MGALEYLTKKYKLDLTQPSPIMIPMGRFGEVPDMFRNLGFTKGAEIGVLQGDYALNLLKKIPNLHLIGVDLWETYPGYKDFEDANLLSEAHKKAIENVKGYNCDLIQGWSDKVADTIPDESLDFVFIDGSHRYEWVVWDMHKWIPKVKKGGVVYGHDYDDYSNRRQWEDMNVMNAVNGWMSSYKIAPWFVITNNRNKCWMYVKE